MSVSNVFVCVSDVPINMDMARLLARNYQLVENANVRIFYPLCPCLFCYGVDF